MDDLSFCDNLREALYFTGTKQKELAEKMSISHKAIEPYIKKAFSLPSSEKTVLITQTLGVTVQYLIIKKNRRSQISLLFSRNI
jgi:transcriptional regulator with XRE-family HTH domain